MAARAYRHQHLAPAPRGWRVRSKRSGDHVLRVAFPPGGRKRGSGRLLEILHPKQNPACENGECPIAQNPVEELLIFGNPSRRNAEGDRIDWIDELARRLEENYRSKIKVGIDPETAERDAIAESTAGPAAIAEFKKRIANPSKSDFSTVYIVATPRHGGGAEVAGPYHITRREAKRIAADRFPSSSYFKPRITSKEPKRQTVPAARGPFSRFLGNPGEYVKAMADRLEGQYRDKRKEGMGHEEALTSTIAHAGGGEPKVLAEFKRRVGNPRRRNQGPWIGRGNFTSRDEAEKLKRQLEQAGEHVRIISSGGGRNFSVMVRKRNAGGIGNHKPGCKCAFCKHAGKVREMVDKMPAPVRGVFDRNPSPAKAVKLFRRMEQLLAQGKIKASNRLRMRLARINAKMGWTMADVAARARGLNPRGRQKHSNGAGRVSSLRRRRNPSEMKQAVSLFETFHGREAEEILEKQESATMRLEYTTLGDLSYLIVQPPSGRPVQINFEGDGVKLASAPNGRQLYAIGGNQNLSSLLDKFTDDPEKDFIDLGDGLEVQYEARKVHNNFAPTDWYHKFGEKNGALPRLMYDKLKKRIFFIGGEYFIDTTDAVSPGIEN